MSEAEKTTQKQILAAAKAEFLTKGFRAAALGQILKIAGVPPEPFMVISAARRLYMPPWWSRMLRR